jgi:hypothetical protein
MRLIPLAHNSKVPLAGDDWHNRISDDPLVHAEWIRRGLNLGLDIEGSQRVIVDFDDKNAGRDFMRKYPELCTVIVETRRGFHFHFSGTTKTRKFSFGDIKGNGYALMPPSIVDGFQYQLLADGPLQPLPEHLFPVMQATRQGVTTVTRGPIKDLDAYLQKVESISGQHGSHGLVRAAAVCRDAGLSEAEATLKLLWWNKLPVVNPPWSDIELARAITRVYEKRNEQAH